MAAHERLIAERFPRTSKYHPEWFQAGCSGGANPLWLTEWLAPDMDLRPGMRVLDVGCGRALSSIFLHREFGVEVYAADLWFSASENLQRIGDAGVEKGVIPIQADARSLPFAEEFFDAIVSIDAFMYFGTDDLYLNYLSRFVKPGGAIGIALAGLMHEIGTSVPAHLEAWWAADRPYCLHSASWWRQHWQRSGIVDVVLADSLSDGWQLWRDWQMIVAPDNTHEIAALEADRGRHLGYVRAVCRRGANAQLFDPSLRVPPQYAKAPLLRD